MDQPLTSKRFHVQELSIQDSLSQLQDDVLKGLFKTPRSLPPKYFYDEEGSRLFDAICFTDDYYPTRTEANLLRTYAEKIVDTVKPSACIEFGAGTSAKTEILLSKILSESKIDEFTYISIDVCKEVLVETAHRLLNKYENLNIQPIVGEYVPAIQKIPVYKSPALYAFIGSSIGNFTEQKAVELLSKISCKMDHQDYFLIGMDRVKDPLILQKAYDDKEGITAEFNLNVLNVLNFNLGSNFDLNKFTHQATYNENESQIEMYLVSKCEQEVTFSTLGKTMKLEKDEKILTEISRKYTKSSIQNLLNKSDLVEVMHFEPENEYFSLVLTKRKI